MLQQKQYPINSRNIRELPDSCPSMSSSIDKTSDFMHEMHSHEIQFLCHGFDGKTDYVPIPVSHSTFSSKPQSLPHQLQIDSI